MVAIPTKHFEIEDVVRRVDEEMRHRRGSVRLSATQTIVAERITNPLLRGALLESKAENLQTRIRVLNLDSLSSQIQQDTPAPAPRFPSSLFALLRLNGNDFVRAAYQSTLHRDADEQGLKHYAEALCNGTSKFAILQILERSEEAQQKRARRHRGAPEKVWKKLIRAPLLSRLAAFVIDAWEITQTNERLRRIENQTAVQAEWQRKNSENLVGHLVEALRTLQQNDMLLRSGLESCVSNAQLAIVAEAIDRSAADALNTERRLDATTSEVRGSIDALRSNCEQMEDSFMRAVNQINRDVVELTEDLRSAATQEQLARQISEIELKIGKVQSQSDIKQDDQLRQISEIKQKIEDVQFQSAVSRDDQQRQISEFELKIAKAQSQLDVCQAQIDQGIGAVRVWANDRLNTLQQTQTFAEHKFNFLLGSKVPSQAEAKAAINEWLAANRDDAERLSDAGYYEFQNRRRGERSDIKGRLQVYTDRLIAAKASGGSAIAIDLGCGRGEWLEILKDNGVRGIGVDDNEAMVAYCKTLKLNAVKTDALSFLRDCASDSSNLITAFHVIEHLELPKLLQLLGEALRVLHPGGILIVETPNPKNVVVGSCNFYTDPTHVKPMPPELTSDLLEAKGFEFIELLNLHPVHAAPMESQNPELQRLWSIISSLVLSHQDYAVIARKPETFAQ